MAKKTFEDQLISDLMSGFKAKNCSATASRLWESASNVKDWVSTGDFMLDLILSNKIDGGVPVGRLTEISGGEGAGKTLLASYILANTQKKGGVAILIDSECSASLDVLARAGIDIKTLIVVNASTTEEVFQTMETIVAKIQTENSNRLITIVWDSVAGTSTKAEIEGDYGDRTIALQARLISQGLRKYIPIVSKYNVCLVFVNQLRTRIGVTFGDDKITPGGKAIPYHASIRLRLSHYKQIKDKDKDLVGRTVQCKVDKNKVAPPMRNIYYTMRWGTELGAWIDSKETMWDSAIRKAVFEKVTAQKYSFTSSTGEKLKFTRKAFNELMNEDNFSNEVKQALAKAYIITAKNFSSEDVSYEDAGEDG